MNERFAVAIMVGSPNSTVDLVRTTFASIRRCFSPGSFRILLQLGTRVPGDVRDLVVEETRASGDITLMGEEDVYWADFINRAIDLSDGCTYFIKSHDDIELLSESFDRRIDDFFNRVECEVGWVSLTDVGYRHGDFSPPVREGFFDDVVQEDAFRQMKVFQFHNLPPRWAQAPLLVHYEYLVGKRIRRKLAIAPRKYPKRTDIEKRYAIDLPSAPVRCHAPFNHFVLIRHDTLRKIGYCENWKTKNALLVDEDWGLRALQLNIPNIWIPDLFYFHNRGVNGEWTRSNRTIAQDAERVAALFAEKWGFHESPPASEIPEIQRRYDGTLITWSIGRRSYEWDFIGMKAGTAQRG